MLKENNICRTSLGKDFILGVATSSYQIEGAVNEDGRKPSIWDDFCRLPGKIRNGDTGDVACDHYLRMEEDVKLLSWLGVDAYRFSIAWPRVIPEGRGTVNPKGLDFYDRLTDALLAADIKPCVTLYHWDLPSALDGGWLNRATVDAFAEFTGVVADRIGDRAAMWFTHNEPWCQAFLGYETGLFAPGHTCLKEALLAAHNILLSHGKSVEILRSKVKTPIGPALNFMPTHPLTERNEDIAAALRQDGYFNRWFVDPIAGRGYPEDMLSIYGENMSKISASDMDIIAAPINILGINYYERCIVSHAEEGVLKLRHEPRPLPHTADREIYPKGLSEIVNRMYKDYKFDNLVVTENGAAYDEQADAEGFVDDQGRVGFLKAHLSEIVELKKDLVPVKGYFAWSLMDNFEWTQGYSMRYGITHVNFNTQKRTPKASAHFLRSLKKDGARS